MGSVEEMTTDLPLHILFFPFLARSHMIPMIQTARLVAERGGARATFVTTPANAHLFLPIIHHFNNPSVMDLQIIPFPSAEFNLPPGLENLTDLPLPLAASFFTALTALSQPLDALLRRLHPDAIVSDALFNWTPSVAATFSIPHIIFQVTGIFPLCAANDLELHRPYESAASVAGDRSAPFSIPGFPHPVKFTRSQLPEIFDYPFMQALLRDAEFASYGVIVNSFYSLEPDYAEHYYKLAPRKVFLIGPVAIAGDPKSSQPPPPSERDPCLEWLDGKEEESVVYVGFGTLSRFSEEQLRELALGLEASGHGFIWAVGGTVGDAWLPENYEQRVAGRGLLVKRWAPQTEILNHKAVGGFVVHCGWNSVLEGICAGVPVVTWPLHSEQFVLEKLLVEVLQIGWAGWDGFKSVKDEEKVVVPAAEVAAAVKRMMGGGEEVEEKRARVRKLAEEARRAVAVGGSSHADLGHLIDGLMDERRKTSRV